ncbi:SDR family oxidoreductase [Hymenobacter sp. BT491]|uniref:SDR family oxidoreductase n=1 Tax=Hymenobacter sp. BT491 TaxID=2766779 RepID=UPI001653B1CD|nr:SDR family oxidoreductase [Hymenobacter sp. BT491]MBC6989568.1 SDR family oxidoreductase [Hymenobacter sp. BT491]
MNRLDNKVAVITGGTSGIGLATAHEFVAQGASVFVTGRTQESVAKVAAELGERGYGIVSDTGSLSDIRALPQAVAAHFPQIDVLFINAGIAKFTPIADVTEAIFDESMTPNFKGAYFTIQVLLPLLRDGSSIILNTSVNAHMGVANASLYAASKAALLSLARNLSAELLPRRIRVNAISPGPVATPLHSSAKLGISAEQLRQMDESTVKQVPLGRYGTPEEIARAALFFASDDSSFVLGAELIVDGGMITL